MKERIEQGNNPREDHKLDRTSDAHRSPTFEIPIRRANEQTPEHLFRDSLANSGDRYTGVEENGDEIR